MSPTAKQLGTRLRALRTAPAPRPRPRSRTRRTSPRVYVIRLEAGQQDPSLSTITALARALGVPATALLALPPPDTDAAHERHNAWLALSAAGGRTRGLSGHRIKRVSYGFTVMVDGKRVRRYNAEWQDRDAAEQGLAEFLLGVDTAKQSAPRIEAPRGMTLGEAVERLLRSKSRQRSVDEYRRIFTSVVLPEFGKDTPLVEITASRIAEHRERRLEATSLRRKDAEGAPRALSAASINRPLALLRHLLRTARDEWEMLDAVPKVRLEREPQGRIRWLSEPEEIRLLDACRRSRASWLLGIVTLAMETGMRLSEVLGLQWDQVELGRGVIRLGKDHEQQRREHTKSGRRREVPMRPAVSRCFRPCPNPGRGACGRRGACACRLSEPWRTPSSIAHSPSTTSGITSRAGSSCVGAGSRFSSRSSGTRRRSP